MDKFLDKNRLAQLKKLSQPRTLLLIAFVVIILLVTWSGIKAVQNNYDLEKEISTLKQQNQVQKLADENQKLQNEYYNSDQYLELSARQNLGLAAPGEKELIVPKNVALSYTKNLTKKQPASSRASKQPFYERNLKSWWNFLLGRQTTGTN